MIREFVVTAKGTVSVVRFETNGSGPPKIKSGDTVALGPLGDEFSGQGTVTSVEQVDNETWRIAIRGTS